MESAKAQKEKSAAEKEENARQEAMSTMTEDEIERLTEIYRDGFRQIMGE